MNSPVTNKISIEPQALNRAAPQSHVSQTSMSQTLMLWDRPNRKLSPAERREAREKARIKRQVVEKMVAYRLSLRDQVFTRGLRAIINRNLNALVSEMIADASKKRKYITTRSNKKV